MLSSKTFDIYQPVNSDESITKVETRTYLPFVKSFNNNDTVEITINRSDVWMLMCDAVLVIKGKKEKVVGAGKVDFVSNAGAFLFETVTYELFGVEVDSVRDPGLVSTIRGYLLYENDVKNELETASWTFSGDDNDKAPFANDDGTFIFRIPLKHMLNFFNEYQMALCGKQTIRLVRAQNDNNALKITAGAGEASGITKGKITINSMELKVNHIYPNDALKVELLEAMKTDNPIMMPYRKWEIHELPSLAAGSTSEIWTVKTTSYIDCPRYVICCFQTKRKNEAGADPTLFDNIDISDVRLVLNGEYIPQENLRMNFKTRDYSEAYSNYYKFAASYGYPRKSSLLTYSNFTDRCLFVIDCSRRDESFKSSTIDVKLEIESRSGFPDNTRAYCIIAHDCIMEYLPLSEVVRKIWSH